MVAQIDEQNAAVVADAVTPAGEPDRLALLGEAEGAAIVRAVTMHGFHFFARISTTRTDARCVAEKARRGKRRAGKPFGQSGNMVAFCPVAPSAAKP